MEANIPSNASGAYRAMKYQELIQEFLYTHSDVLTPVEIAQKNEIEKHFVDFKLNMAAPIDCALQISDTRSSI